MQRLNQLSDNIHASVLSFNSAEVDCRLLTVDEVCSLSVAFKMCILHGNTDMHTNTYNEGYKFQFQAVQNLKVNSRRDGWFKRPWDLESWL